jgi:lysophospholipase L1-like esterase
MEGMLHFLNLPPKGLYEGDPATLWTLRPNLDRSISNTQHSFHIQTDSQGFRRSNPATNSTIISTDKWLVLGCSTTFGWGVEDTETWPAQLSQLINIPIINGGVPGWSTHQAKQKVFDWRSIKPSVVLVSYIVRDAQFASLPDKEAKPTPKWHQLQLYRLLQTSLTAPSNKSVGTVPRVSPEEYRNNLLEIKSAFPDSIVLFFPFPQQQRSTKWINVIHDFKYLSLDSFESSLFFTDDPIHLTKEGHIQLAQQLKASLVDASILLPSH